MGRSPYLEYYPLQRATVGSTANGPSDATAGVAANAASAIGH